MPSLIILVLTTAILLGCGDVDSTPVAVADTNQGVLTDTGTEPAADTGTELAADAAGAGDVSAPSCELPTLAPDPPDRTQTRFALALFHYNLQYVIGGLQYVDDEGRLQTIADVGEQVAGWDNQAIEDWIIVETFVPILEIYERHPQWRVDIEMQAYMVEVLAQRHPEALELLRRLAHRGQVELISFHYADQLFLAYPREDMVASIARTRSVFEDHCLPLSGVVFNQEGQAGEGRQRLLVDQGYAVGVHPKNLWRYARGDEPRWPWYESEGGTLIVGPGGVDADSGVEVAWDFFDDGELRATLEYVNPYTAVLGGADPERLAQYEAQLMEREAQGWKMTHIGDYVRQLEALGVDKPAAPPLLDGTWQPQSTDSIHRWLGGRSQVFVGQDDDNWVRTGNAEARVHAAATRAVAAWAEARGVQLAAYQPRLDRLWEDLWHAMVSDASGVNPWRGELIYCVRKNAAVRALGAELRRELAEAAGLSGAYLIDTRDGTLTPGAVLEQPDWQATEAEGMAVVEAELREVGLSAALAGPVTRLTVDMSAATGECPSDEVKCDGREIIIRFPRAHDVIAYSPGLIEDEVRSYPFDVFTLLRGEVYLPLANGLIGLAADRWVVKDVRTCHSAARVAPDDPTIAFIDRTVPEEQARRCVFYLIDGDADLALRWANRVNVHPFVAVGADSTLTIGPGGLPR